MPGASASQFRGNDRRISFVQDRATWIDLSQGPVQPTGNPLDVMIEGQGYLSVEAPHGSTAYTRAGQLKMLPSGELATSSGNKVLGEGGRPITIPPEAANQIEIGKDGTINGPGGPFGRITVTQFDEAGVDPRGDGLFSGTGGRELPAGETHLQTGGLEGSNVNAIQETTDMVEILRAYQNSQRMSESMSDMRKKAIEQLGKAE